LGPPQRRRDPEAGWKIAAPPTRFPAFFHSFPHLKKHRPPRRAAPQIRARRLAIALRRRTHRS
jgi:hypothetical protein